MSGGGVAATTPADDGFLPEIRVSSVTELDPEGDTVHVTGSGFDETRGIYVALCVVPPPGMTPTPCGGGIDREGATGASQWISSNPPDYGDGVAQPYDPGGRFAVDLHVSALLGPDIDCRLVQCAVVTRADHTRLTDRSLDVIVPVLFAARPATTPAGTTPATPAGASTGPTTSTLAPGAPVTDGDTAAGLGGRRDLPGGAPRGAAPTWPVWATTGVAAAVLAVLARRRPATTSPRRTR